MNERASQAASTHEQTHRPSDFDVLTDQEDELKELTDENMKFSFSAFPVLEPEPSASLGAPASLTFEEQIEALRKLFNISPDVIDPAGVLVRVQLKLTQIRGGLPVHVPSAPETAGASTCADSSTFIQAFFDSPIAMAIIRPDGSFVTINHSWIEMTGIDHQDCGKGFGVLSVVDASCLDHIYTLLGDFASGEMKHWAGPSIIRNKRNIEIHKVFQVQLTLTAVQDSLLGSEHLPERHVYRPLLCSVIESD